MSCDPLPADAAESRPPALPEGVPPLVSFYLYLTSGCNLHCRHCWIVPSFVGGKADPGECLDVALLRRAVEEAKPLGLCSAKLTGGEPLLHPRFVEIVDMLTEAGLALHMETNGTLIDAELARYLKEKTSLNFISVSIDGPDAAVHDSFRGVPGSFDAAVRGFRHLVEAGYRPQWIMSLHRGNVRHVEAVAEMAVRLGAASVKYNPVMRSGRGAGMHERGEALDVEEILRLARFIRGELQRRTPIRLILGTPPALYTVGELQSGLDGLCPIRHILGILGSGDLALCGIGRTVPELCFGNLREVSVVEVWQSHPTLLRLREELDGAYPGVCGACLHARHCLTYCAAQNYQDGGRLVSPYWLCAEAYKRGLFPSGRLRGPL